MEILLTVQTCIFLTRYHQFHYVNDTELKGQICQFHFNVTLKSSLSLLSNRLSSLTVLLNSNKANNIFLYPCAVFKDKFEQREKHKDQFKLYCIRRQRQSLTMAWKKACLDMNMMQGAKSIYGQCTCALCFGS